MGLSSLIRKRNPIAKELREAKYRPRVVEDKRRKLERKEKANVKRSVEASTAKRDGDV